MSNESGKQTLPLSAGEVCDQLSNAVRSIPFETIKRDAEINNRLYLKDTEDEVASEIGRDVNRRARNCRENVKEQIGHLMDHAGAGDAESIRALIELATNISETLRKWSDPLVYGTVFVDGANTETSENQDAPPSAPADEWEKQFVDSFHTLLKVPSSALKILHGEITKRLDYHLYHSTSKMVKTTHCPDLDPKISAENANVVRCLIDDSVALRMDEERAILTRKIAREMSEWPIVIPAITDNIECITHAYMDTIQLGHGMGVKVKPNTKGRPRDVTARTTYGLVIECFWILENERRALHSDAELHSYREDENNEVGEEPQPRKKRNIYREFVQTRDSYEKLTGWTISNIWKRKAALLPVLSKENDVAKKWADAALALLVSWGYEFDDKSPWPQDILDRYKGRQQDGHNDTIESIACSYFTTKFKAFAEQ